MSILVNRDSRVICQGITGSNGRFHSEQCQRYGTRLVGGVTPGKGGTEVLGVPVFDMVSLIDFFADGYRLRRFAPRFL